MRYWPLSTMWVHWLARSNEAPERRPSEVEDGIWVGGIPVPARWSALQAAGVTRVVTLVGEAAPMPWLRSAESLLWLPVHDNHAPTMDQLRRGCAFLDSARRDGPATLISCGAGIGRASTLYLAWRIATTGEPLQDALKALKQRRPIVDPTRRQLEALGQWEEELRG